MTAQKSTTEQGNSYPLPYASHQRETLFLFIAVFLLGLAVWLAYGSALHTPFLFDDGSSVTKNPSLLRLWPLWDDSIHFGPLNPPNDLPTSGRPLVNLSLALNYHFGKFDPSGYHAFNLVVHLLSVILLMLIVRRILRLDYFSTSIQNASGLLSFMAALLWALHPLQTETVVYVTQRTELMVGFFYLATIYAALRYWAAATSAGRAAWLVVAAIVCLAGMACKEVMVTAPVVVLLIERTFVAGSFRRALQNSWPLYVCLTLTWTLLLALNLSGPRSYSAGFDRGIPVVSWWLTQTKVLLLYLKLTFWPWPLAIYYEMPYLASVGDAWSTLLPVALLAFATLILFWRRTAVGFVGACVFIVLSPTLVVPIVTEVAAERRMYLPLAAIVTFLVVGAYWLALQVAKSNRGSSQSDGMALPAVAVVVFVIALIYGSLDVRRLDAYQDEIAFWQDAASMQPENYLVQYNLANALVRSNRSPEAILHYQQALELKPTCAEAHCNWGLELAKAGQFNDAIAHYQRAIQIRPTYVEAWANMGLANAALDHSVEAIACAEKAVEFARQQHQNVLAEQVQSWLTNYRAQQVRP